jgi:lactoylglutathione lyase
MALLLIQVWSLAAPQDAGDGRPKILGLSHVAFFVSDLGAATRFYRDLLGFDVQPRRGGGVGAIVRINERQWVELVAGPSRGEGQLDHVALQTDDVRRMRLHLEGRGIKAAPVTDGHATETVSISDPDGHRVEFAQATPVPAAPDAPPRSGDRRVSTRPLHAGILVGDLARAARFYGDVLGFQEFWRGSAAASKTLSWVNMRAPDGTEYLEFMLYAEMPPPDRRGSAHHLCLVVSDAHAAAALLESRRAASGYTRAIEVRTGINRKRQVNLFDPDGTRVELMEPDTVDGRPAPSSTLPPPR